MNKKLIFLNILFVIAMLLSACGATGSLMPESNQASGMHNASLALQTTEEPPLPFPTIVINPTPGPGSGGSFPQIDLTTMLLFVLVGAIILIALIAVLKR